MTEQEVKDYLATPRDSRPKLSLPKAPAGWNEEFIAVFDPDDVWEYDDEEETMKTTQVSGKEWVASGKSNLRYYDVRRNKEAYEVIR